MGVFRISTYLNGYRSHKAGYRGNMIGEGRLLGGVYLFNRDEMIFNHPERSWGDAADPNQVKKALQKLPTSISKDP
jgi:hypothetical protein